jgi:hypothetical protein
MFSHKFKDHEKNWPVHDKELFAIVYAFERYRHFLRGKFTVEVTTNAAYAVWAVLGFLWCLMVFNITIFAYENLPRSGKVTVSPPVMPPPVEKGRGRGLFRL